MSEITVTINGKECKAKEGEYILNIARRNGIFIPALCYLNGCSPTLACRICLVEADGKRVYSCNTKAKDGMVIITDNEEISKERRSIMEVYDVNHPLTCGVCDQSGECELQNYNSYIGVDEQHFAIKDTARPVKKWGLMHYDSSLCIVCERCVTVCKDMIGDSALKTVPRGGDKLAKEWKESMPKDAYAMWNKLQKSIIGTASGDTLDCTNCGECIAVCPVGALVSSDFQYKSNAWELKKIPAACSHCSAACFLNYEVKHTSIDNPEKKIYRVTNEWTYQALCGAGRFGFDFQNTNAKKDTEKFEEAVEFISKKADTIRFSSFITNEEALILQKIKEKFNLKLVNDDAYQFKSFLQNYSKTSGTTLYSGSLSKIKKSNFVVSVGSAIKTDNPAVRFSFNNALKMNKGAGLYFHPVADPVVEGFSKNLVNINHKPGVEESIMYLLLDLFADKEKLPKSVSEYLHSLRYKTTRTVEEIIKEKVTEKVIKKVIDEESGETKEIEEEVTKMVPKKISKEIEVELSKLADTVSLADDFNEKLEKLLAKKDTFTLILGPDLYAHPRAKNIAALAGLIQRYTDFDVVLIPSQTNTLGVSLICDLDENAGKSVIGYNAPGDFTLSALGDGDLDMPALNQQEGTFTNIDKRVVPINVALEFKGYCLNDIASSLGIKKEYTIDYTKELPTQKGYKAIAFDDLENYFDNAGNEHRGYQIENIPIEPSDEVEEVEEIESFDGIVVYRCEPVLQFSAFTGKCPQLKTHGGLFVSAEFLQKHNLNDGDAVDVEINEHKRVRTMIKLDNKIKGQVAYLPTFDKMIDAQKIFGKGYRYAKVLVKGISHE